MATRLTASEARLKAESAQKSIEVQKKRMGELNKSLAKERAIIKKGFETQRSKVIFAAIDGRTEIELDKVYLYRYFVDVGIQVVEEGHVTKQVIRQEKVVDTKQQAKVKKEILEAFDEFIDASKIDLKSYYGGFELFHSFNYAALYEAINSTWGWSEFSGDEIFFEEVPDDLKAKYEDYFEKINKKIRKYKETVDELEFDEEDDYESESNELINGEYLFGVDDEEVELLEPSNDGNKLKIRWTSEESCTFMNDPLLSDVGLAWLSNKIGQKLLDEIFYAINSAAVMGKTNTKLNFSLSNEGWSFLNGHRKIFCCNPDELVEVIERQSYSTDSASPSENTYSIKVSW